MNELVANYQQPTFCKWCGEPVELTNGKLYPWQHQNPLSRCTMPQPAKIGEALPFVGAHKQVMQGSECVAVARSRNFAKRIARALNSHKPNERGY